MNEKTLTALQKSIQLYKSRAEAPNKLYNFYAECPLCILFNNWRIPAQNLECEGCPIFADTGQQSCRGNAPYNNILMAREVDRTFEMFTDEAKYLESLLPHE